MKIETDEFLTEVIFGNGTRELRGNFEELTRETEEGPLTSYRCDAYRTTDPDATFEQLQAEAIAAAERAELARQYEEARAFLAASDYIPQKYGDQVLLGKDTTGFLDHFSATLQMTYAQALELREEAREAIRAFEALS
jgi:hypothetical protein